MKYSEEHDGREGIDWKLGRKLVGNQEKPGETPMNWHQLKRHAKVTTTSSSSSSHPRRDHSGVSQTEGIALPQTATWNTILPYFCWDAIQDSSSTRFNKKFKGWKNVGKDLFKWCSVHRGLKSLIVSYHCFWLKVIKMSGIWQTVAISTFCDESGWGKKWHNANFGSIKAQCTCLPRTNRAMIEEWSRTVTSPRMFGCLEILPKMYVLNVLKKMLGLSTMSRIVSLQVQMFTVQQFKFTHLLRSKTEQLFTLQAKPCPPANTTQRHAADYWRSKHSLFSFSSWLLGQPSSSVWTEVSLSKRPVRVNGINRQC